MSITFTLFRSWNAWYRVLRYRNGFSFKDSVRYGLWLARSSSRDGDAGVKKAGTDRKLWSRIRRGARTLFRGARTETGAAHRDRRRAFA